MTIKLFPAMPKISGDAPPLPFDEMSRYRAAASHARRIFPGALGELGERELSAYAEFGYRFSNDGLIPRLAAAVLATQFEPAQPDHPHDSSSADEATSTDYFSGSGSPSSPR
jgi:hypothetical protein